MDDCEMGSTKGKDEFSKIRTARRTQRFFYFPIVMGESGAGS